MGGGGGGGGETCFETDGLRLKMYRFVAMNFSMGFLLVNIIQKYFGLSDAVVLVLMSALLPFRFVS